MGVLLGIDFGQKRIGVSVSDAGALIAFALTTIENRNRRYVLDRINGLVAEHGAETIVAGYPINLKGLVGPAAQKIGAEVEWFRPRTPVPWILWDERLSTAEAERVLEEADLGRRRRQEVRDQLAAQRILQNYLDYLQMGGKPRGITE